MHEPLPLGSTATNTAPAPCYVLHRDYETRGRVICIVPGGDRVLPGNAQELVQHLVVAGEGLLHECPQSWRHINSVDRAS